MKILTVETLVNQDYEILDLVKGSTVDSKHLGKDLMSGLKGIVGGEIKAYTEMLDQARTTAINRMVEEAEALNADAIICVRFASSSIMQSAAEILVYGTAIRFK